MGYQIYFRIFGYVVTMVMHISNIIYMASGLTDHVKQDPKIRAFAELQNRFFTCWTFFLQIAYAALALLCDVLILKNGSNKKYKVPFSLEGRRDLIFSALLWPATWLVFSVFWPLYLYDRRLIFPKFTDKVLTSTSNHIIHTAIIPVVLWEVIFRPRTPPKSHVKNITHLTVYMLVYLSVLIYTYFERQIWLYPVFKVAYGSIIFPVIILTVFVALLSYYAMQWPLTALIHGKPAKTNKKTSKKIR